MHMPKYLFPGGNTALGFFSFYDHILRHSLFLSLYKSNHMGLFSIYYNDRCFGIVTIPANFFVFPCLLWIIESFSPGFPTLFNIVFPSRVENSHFALYRKKYKNTPFSCWNHYRVFHRLDGLFPCRLWASLQVFPGFPQIESRTLSFEICCFHGIQPGFQHFQHSFPHFHGAKEWILVENPVETV